MAPRENKFTMVMTDDEKRMLEALAQADDRSAAAWIRGAIKAAYGEKLGAEKSKKRKK
jgi:hypothetical protein